MNNNIQCSIESSTTKIELNSAVDGVFLVPELEGLVGLPEIRTTSGVNAGYDGGWTSAQHYDARLISIRGVIASPDISKVEDKRRAIASLLGQGRKEQLTLRFTTEAGNAYAISVRTISCEMALQRMLTTQEFLIQLRADDPLIYDDGTTGGIAAILQPQRALGGFEIDFELPLAIGGGAEDTVVDNGNETVYPVIKMYGALHSPTVVNRTTNQQMQILADLQYSIDWHTYRSATGDYILVNGGLDGAPMTLSQFFGNAEQTTYSGKNLLPPTEDWTQTINGVAIKYASGVYTFSGTATANGSTTAHIVVAPYTIQAGDYFHYCNSLASPNINIQLVFTDNTSFATSMNVTNRVFPIDNYNGTSYVGKTIASYRVNFASGFAFNGTASPMILHNVSTVSDYEPYTGGSPMPNPSFPSPVNVVTGAQTVKITGKNLLSITANSVITRGTYVSGANTSEYRIKATDNDIFVNAVGAVGASYTEAGGNLISCNYGETIYFSTGNNDFQKNYFTEWDENMVSLGYTLVSSPSGTYTPTKPNCKYVSFRFGSGYSVTGTTYTLAPIVCKASDTSFEPYQEQSYTVDLDTIELAKIGNYQDRIYRSNGKWYIEKQVGKVVLDGTESTWGIFGNNNAFYSGAYDVQTPSSTTTAGAIMANYYTADSESNIYNARVDYGIGVSGERRILVRNKDITTVADFRAWLASNKPTVYYALATPITTEITDETLLYQLNFLASLYEGVNNISLVGTGAQGEMVIRYATDYTVNQDIITIDSQARTITLNGQDIYHLKTSESEFLVLAPGENKLYLTSEVSDDSGYAEVKFKQGYLSI